MNYKFQALISKNPTTNKIQSVYLPDFNLLIPADDLTTDLNALILQKLIMLARREPCVKPRDLAKLLQPIDPSLQTWQEFSFDLHPGYFQRYLPIIGHLTNNLAIVTGCYSTYMALCVASSSGDNSRKDNNLSIAATALSALINLIMYTYSDTSSTLAAIGNNIDKSLHLIDVDEMDSNNTSSFKRKAFSSLMMGVLLANLFIQAISVYQETVLLAEKYLDLKPNTPADERKQEMELIRLFAIDLMIASSVFSSLAFQWSFATRFVDDLSAKISNWHPAKPLCFNWNNKPKGTLNETIRLLADQASDISSSTFANGPPV